MPRSTTYAVLHLRDAERDVVHARVLGALDEVYATPIVVGSDPSCDVILADPRVPARAVVFGRRNRHEYYAMQDGADCGRRPIAVGPFHVSIGFTTMVHELPPPIADARLRFSPRFVEAAPVPPRAAVARQVAARASHVQVLDAATRRWCEDQIRGCFAALSLELERVDYVGPRAAAIAYWTRAWQAVCAQRFDPAAWPLVHRFERWHRRLQCRDDYFDAHRFAASHERDLQLDGGDPVALLTCHVATFEDDAGSPAHPLAALLERGLYPLALPGNAMLLVCDEPLHRSSDPAEDQILAAGDPATAMVLADHLEQRGALARATALRDGALDPLLPQPVILFPEARPILLRWSAAHPQLILDDPPVPLALEIGGERRALEPATTLDAVQLTWVEGVLLAMRRGPELAINGLRVTAREPLAVFDGDVLEGDDLVATIVRT